MQRVPGARFLTRSTGEAAKPDTEGQEQVAKVLVETLGHFGIEAKVIGRVTGPHITRYELRLAPGIKVSKVAQLKDDLAYALAATDIRILAPIPGKHAVGVLQEGGARRRDRDAPRGPGEKGNPQFLLQLSNLVAQMRCREVKPLSRPAKVALFGNDCEVLQLLE